MCLLTMTATILFFGKPLGRLIHSVTVPSGSGDISLQYIGDRYRIGQCEEYRRMCGNIDVGT